MGKGIDFEYIQRMMDENPQDWWSPRIAKLRTDGALKRAMGMRPSVEELEALALGPDDDEPAL